MQICFLVRTNSKDTGKGRVIIVSTYCFSLSSTSSSPITELHVSLGNYPNSLLALIVGAPVKFSSVAQSCPTLWSQGLQHARLPCPSSTPRACSNSCPLNQWCHPTILSSVVSFSSHLQSLQNQGLFQWVSSSHQVAKVLEFQLQHQSFQWIFRTDFL